MHASKLPGSESRQVNRWIPIVAVGAIIAGLLILGHTRIAAVSNGTTANLDTSRQVFEQLNGNHLVATQELYTDDAAIHTPEGEYQGPTGAGKFMAALDDAFPNASYTIRQMEIVGDFVFALWTMTGAHHGAYQGRPASCSAVALDGVTVMRFEDQLIDEQWIHYDRLAIVRQIDAFNQLDPSWRPICRNR